MVNINIDEDTLVEMLVKRVHAWTDDEDIIDLFEQYYENMVYGGYFEDADLDVKSIVDNDYVNNTSIITREEFEEARDKYIEKEESSLRRSGKKWWWVLMILSILLVAAGIIIFNNPWWHTTHSFVKVIGGVILFAAVAGFIRLVLVWPIRKA